MAVTTTLERNRALGISEDAPCLVFWKESLSAGDDPAWQSLTGHSCNGFALDYFGGNVIGLRPEGGAGTLLESIANEDFCAGINQSECECSNADSLDWGVEEAHRCAYASWVREKGLLEARIDLLQQAVYPLAATAANLERLGCTPISIPDEACLIVLGFNCD